MSAQKRTHAVQQKKAHSITSSAPLLECRYLKLIKSVRLNVEALGFKGSFLAFALF